MDLLNFEVKNGRYLFHSIKYDDVKGKAKIIHWLPNDGHQINVEVLMPDNNALKGFGEVHLENLNSGDIVHFVRLGFCRLHEIKNDTFVFWFAHN